MASNSTWTLEQHKKFQNALAIYGIDETPGMWCYLVRTTGKTEEEIKSYYEKLMVEIKKIESAPISLPRDEEAELEARNEEKDVD
uniref:MYB transcription factor MYB164 n=1 Tax=Solanum tuberosum TaxID=4113 RepID=M1B8X5_SOLTU